MNLLFNDLDHVLQYTQSTWRQLRGKTILITGGTGFIGTWLVETLLHANEKLHLDVRLLILTRNPDSYKKRMPHLAINQAVSVLHGDMTNFEFPAHECQYVIHGAT